MNQLLASAGWVLDVIFFVVLILGMLYGVHKGLINSVCKLTGKIFAIVFAVMFCVSFANFLESAFGMTTAIANGLTSAFSGKEAYSVALSDSDILTENLSAALKEAGVGSLSSTLIAFAFRNVELIPAGTTAAYLVSSVFAKWIAIAISFVILFLLLFFGLKYFGKLLSRLVDAFAPFRVINQVAGGLFSLVETLIFIFIALMIASWLPLDGLHTFISSSSVVGAIFDSDWFAQAVSYAVSGEWFSEYIAEFLPAA